MGWPVSKLRTPKWWLYSHTAQGSASASRALTTAVYQARREAEMKLHPLQQREADLTEELNRQKEKERLRKEYIEVCSGPFSADAPVP